MSHVPCPLSPVLCPMCLVCVCLARLWHLLRCRWQHMVPGSHSERLARCLPGQLLTWAAQANKSVAQAGSWKRFGAETQGRSFS